MQTLLEFLSRLRENNQREWLEAHRSEYESTREEFYLFVSRLIKELASLEPAVAMLEPKDCIFRLYRDIRFSKDKTPFKTHYGAYFAPGGKKSTKAGYYLHIEPSGRSMLAGGVYMPSPEDLKKIREEIDYNGEQLRIILNCSAFRKNFGTISGAKLRTTPKGYAPDHPDIELLKHKDFIASHLVDDATVASADFITYAIKVWKTLKPLNDYMNKALE